MATPYTLDSGDRLSIVVFGQTDLSKTYAVDGGGNLAMPLIGAVPARGLTIRELENKIAQELRQGFLRDPNVTVEVQTYRPFFVLGEVRNPGQYPYVNGMTIQTAVAIAGGYTERANKRLADISRQYSGRIIKGRVGSDYPIQPGDTVSINERFF
ncbi:MAG: polysaccharide export protein [Fimbriimonadaceae bacterium]|nr:polysaccharide export protein [Alphaproteobacteria bacterium]